MYTLKLMGGEKFNITKEEYIQLNTAKGLVYIKSCGVSINVSSISSIYEEGYFNDRKEQKTGVLYDGLRVKRNFGQWVIDRQVPDDKNNYGYVNPDAKYYPEIAKDYVATEQEHEKLKELPKEEYYKALFGDNKTLLKESNKKVESIGDIIKN